MITATHDGSEGIMASSFKLIGSASKRCSARISPAGENHSLDSSTYVPIPQIEFVGLPSPGLQVFMCKPCIKLKKGANPALTQIIPPSPDI